MLFALIQFGLVFYGWTELRNVVQTGGRFAAIGNLGSYAGQPSTPPPCQSLTDAEQANGLLPGDEDTADMYCAIADQIGTPVGTTVSSANPPQISLSVPTIGSGLGTVKVCARVQAQMFTSFFPSITLSSSSDFYIEDPGASQLDPLESYNPYNLSGC